MAFHFRGPWPMPAVSGGGGGGGGETLYEGTATTTDATPTLVTIEDANGDGLTLGADEALWLQLEAIGRERTGGTRILVQKQVACVYQIGGGGAFELEGSPSTQVRLTTAEETDADLGVTATAPAVRVTGSVGETWDWRVRVRVLRRASGA